MKTRPPQTKPVSWYPTQAETLQTQRDQMIRSKQDARAFASDVTTTRKTPWWSKRFWRT